MNIIGFIVCVENEGNGASLEKRKIYGVAPAEAQDPADYLRIVDESGEDYLYPADWFEPVSLGSRIEARLMESIVV